MQTIYIEGPNGTPLQLSGAVRLPDDAKVLTEEEAMKQWAEIEAADLVEIAKAQAQRDKLLAGAFVALTSGTPLSAEQAMALGARSIAEN